MTSLLSVLFQTVVVLWAVLNACEELLREKSVNTLEVHGPTTAIYDGWELKVAKLFYMDAPNKKVQMVPTPLPPTVASTNTTVPCVAVSPLVILCATPVCVPYTVPVRTAELFLPLLRGRALSRTVERPSSGYSLSISELPERT